MAAPRDSPLPTILKLRKKKKKKKMEEVSLNFQFILHGNHVASSPVLEGTVALHAGVDCSAVNLRRRPPAALAAAWVCVEVPPLQPNLLSNSPQHLHCKHLYILSKSNKMKKMSYRINIRIFCYRPSERRRAGGRAPQREKHRRKKMRRSLDMAKTAVIFLDRLSRRRDRSKCQKESSLSMGI